MKKYILCHLQVREIDRASENQFAMGGKISYHERVGGGKFGDVYRVTWKSKEHGSIEAAAKKIRYDSEVTAEQEEEVGFLKRLNHKNIIKYYDTIMEKEHVVIITEYAAKGSLYRYLKDKDKLSEHLQRKWIHHLACGIDYLRKNNLTHRDLKSPNCVITAEDVLKICDFGLARYLTCTTTTDMKGTIRWLAPEAIKDQQLSPQADIFAFGIITWEIVSCEEPYKGMRVETIMYQVCETGLRPKIPDDCSHFLRDLMEKCWHGDRNQRPESGEIVKVLDEEYGNTFFFSFSLLIFNLKLFTILDITKYTFVAPYKCIRPLFRCHGNN